MIDSPPIRHTQWRDYQLHLIILGLGLVLLFSPAKTTVEQLIYDLVLNTQIKQNNNHVAVITIDDKSINQIGQWPWGRDTHADLLSILASSNTKAIGFDVIFSGASRYPQDDELFSAQLKKSNNVVLAVAPSGSTPFATAEYELLPTPLLAKNAAILGHVDFELDSDGTIRKVFLNAGYKETKWPSFGLALASLHDETVNAIDSDVALGNGWVRKNPRLLSYQQVKGGIDSYSYVDVLNGTVDLTKLNDKVILIGMTASAMGDRFITPTSPSHSTTPGVFINAHLVNDILNKTEVIPLPKLLLNIIYGINALLVFFVFFKVKLNLMLPVLMAFIVIDTLATILLYNLIAYWFSPIVLIASQCLIYALFILVKSDQLFSEVSTLNHNLVHDRVTSLANELGLNNKLKKLTKSVDEPAFHLFTIKFGKFKGINDLLGTEAGDELLLTAKEQLQTLFPNAVAMARYHGAEFSICIPVTRNKNEIEDIGNSILTAFSKPFLIRDQLFKLPVCIGVASFPSDATHRLSLLDATESALHRALEKNESNMCVYSHDIKLKLKERAKLESDLAKALDEGEIDIFYQPQVDASTSKIVGAEALARWHHPELGMISPDVFIPIAESTGLIIDIGNWILCKACKRAKKIQNNGNPTFRIAVNLSSIQFAHSRLIEEVEAALSSSGLAPEFLELELTESCVVDDINAAVTTLNQLKKIGISLSIDDFGTGYSSLSYLKHFPMDRIKIDRSFVSGINDGQNNQEITLAIIAMANSLNMKVIAEGIETPEQQSFLSENKVDELQGFYFGKPVPVDQLEALLASKTQTVEND